jgi:hypothetical protein
MIIPFSFVKSGVVFCAEALALFARMTTQPTFARKVLINDFIVGCKIDGNWALLDYLYMLAAPDSQRAQLNWISSSFNITNVNSTTLATDRGFVGADTKYLDTNFNAFTSGVNYTRNSASYGYYLNVIAGVDYDMGVKTASANSYCRVATTNFRGQINNVSEIEPTSAYTGTSGMFSFKRTNSSNYTQLLNGAVVDTVTDNSVAPANANIYLLCINYNGVASFFANAKRMACNFAGSGAIDHAKLYTRLNTYLTAIGAN